MTLPSRTGRVEGGSALRSGTAAGQAHAHPLEHEGHHLVGDLLGVEPPPGPVPLGEDRDGPEDEDGQHVGVAGPERAFGLTLLDDAPQAMEEVAPVTTGPLAGLAVHPYEMAADDADLHRVANHQLDPAAHDLGEALLDRQVAPGLGADVGEVLDLVDEALVHVLLGLSSGRGSP